MSHGHGVQVMDVVVKVGTIPADVFVPKWNGGIEIIVSELWKVFNLFRTGAVE